MTGPSAVAQFVSFSAVYFLVLAAAGAAARRALRRAGGGPLPERVSVVVACKGGGAGLEANIMAMLDQDFPGRIDYIFVVPRAEDPARARLERALAGAPRSWRVTVSEAKPRRTTELILNFLHGAALADPAGALLVFAPCDIRPPRGWVRALAEPFSDPAVGAATTTVVCVPSGDLLPATLKSLWNAAACAFHALDPVVSGQSFALRRTDFVAWKVAERWSVSLVEDLVTDLIVKSQGRRVALAAGGTPCGPEPASWRDLWVGYTRWLFFGRIYTPWLWLKTAALVAGKLAAIPWMAYFPGLHPVLAVFLLGDAVAAWWLMRAFAPALDAQEPEIRKRYAVLSAAAALAMPLLAPLIAFNLLGSLGSRSFVWSGYRYTARGPADIDAAGA